MKIAGDQFAELYEQWLKANYFSGRSPEYYQTVDYRNSVAENTFARAERFERHMIPWIMDAFDLTGANVVEIGSGTGSSTQALHPYCKSIVCYETEPVSMAAAKKRASLLHMDNVRFAEHAFRASTVLLNRDAVIFVGVLEHMSFAIVEEVLATAYRILRPGGVIIVTDTPNRLSAFDYHTSWLPFFQWLPPELQERYYRYSPREHFVDEIGAFAAEGRARERIKDWGIGISYHEFELALGSNVHDMIIADGWEEKMLPLANVFVDDRWLLDMFEKMQLKAHKAFARSWLNLIIRKPA